MNVPTLETARLILRLPVKEDFPAHFSLWGDPRTVRHFGGITYDEADTWLRFLRNFGQWHLMGYGFWGVVEKDSRRYVGSLGFVHAKRSLDWDFRDLPEMGWAIHPDRHGRGYATEAVAAAQAWGDTHIEAPRTWCMINESNAISRKVAERAGYSFVQMAQFKDMPVVILDRPRGGRQAVS